MKGEATAMKRFRCPVCGYEYAGEAPPEFCAACRAPGESFVGIKPARKPYPAEYIAGITAGIDADMLGELRRAFASESMRAGVYLAMARAADREGYPEISEALRRYASGKANHAARFAEMLGDDVSVSAEQNLERCAAAERGACAEKTRLAMRAKELNLDAVHDALHEMARDDAQHGGGMEGLLKRFFPS
jgi:rubrerythrin